MSEITQQLGLDASKALAELQKLNTALETTQNNMRNLAQAFRDFNSMSGQSTRAIAAVSKATAKGTAQVATAASRNLNNATQSVDRFTTSLQLLSRIVFTQFVVSGFGKIKRAIGDSVNSAIEFETQLAEIGTIANGTLGSLNNTGDAVRRISDAFNIPLADSARGLYETLSSQIAEGAKSIEFLEESAAFAKGTITTTENAVALLSGTLNAFGKSADDAGHVASVFFRTIDLGNVTAEQLKTSFNLVTAQANQLGVSFEEVAAAFATMTNRGLAHNEAATQLRAIMTALVKPSAAMTEALRQLGFSSSEVAIQTLGLGGLLKELQQSSGQTAEAMAKLFPNVRGLSGALSLGAQANAQYNDALKQIRDTASDLSRQKSLDILSTDAQRVAAEMNKFSNLITVDIGQATLKGFANLSQFTGGVDNLTAVVQNAGPVLATGTALLGAYAAAALAGARGNAAFAASFRGVSAGLLLLAGAYSGGDLIGRRLIDAISGPQLEFDRQQREAIKQLEKANADRLRLQREADAERIRAALAATRDLNAAYLADVTNAERAAGLLEKSIGRTADSIVRQREGLAQAIRRAGDDTARFAQQSASRVLGLQDLRDERQFADRTKALTDAQKVFALSKRANELAARAAQQLAEGGDIARAIAQFDRAQATGEAAAAIAERAGNRSLEARAAKALEDVTQRQIRAEQELQRVQQRRQSVLADLDRRQAAMLDTVREQAAIIRDNSRITGADGQLLDPAEIASRQQAAQAAIERLRQTGFTPDDLRAFDAAGLGDAARTLNMALAGQTLQLQFDITGEVDRIQQTLRASFQRFRVGLHFDVGQLETLLGTTFRSPDDVSRGLSQAAAEADKLRQSLAQVGVTEAHIQRLKVGIQGIAAQSDTTSRSLMRLVGFNTTAVSESTALVDSIRQQLVALAQSGSITDAELSSVQQQLATLADQALTSGGKAANIGLATDLNEFSRALGLLIELQQAQRQLPAVDPTPQLQQLESFLQTLPQAMNAGAAGAERIAAAGAAFEDSVRRGVAALSVAPAQGFAFGGAARGVDRIPAMLSPGEFVVNARSSRQFFSQLQAMNAGQQPVYRQDGGSITNNIGDVVINTNTNQPSVMARDMMRAISRELRRGSGKF